MGGSDQRPEGASIRTAVPFVAKPPGNQGEIDPTAAAPPPAAPPTPIPIAPATPEPTAPPAPIPMVGDAGNERRLRRQYRRRLRRQYCVRATGSSESPSVVGSSLASAKPSAAGSSDGVTLAWVSPCPGPSRRVAPAPMLNISRNRRRDRICDCSSALFGGSRSSSNSWLIALSPITAADLADPML